MVATSGLTRHYVVFVYRVCKIEAVDGSNITAYYVHECEAVNRTGLRSRRFVFTGHFNGSVQVELNETKGWNIAYKFKNRCFRNKNINNKIPGFFYCML